MKESIPDIKLYLSGLFLYEKKQVGTRWLNMIMYPYSFIFHNYMSCPCVLTFVQYWKFVRALNFPLRAFLSGFMTTFTFISEKSNVVPCTPWIIALSTSLISQFARVLFNLLSYHCPSIPGAVANTASNLSGHGEMKSQTRVIASHLKTPPAKKWNVSLHITVTSSQLQRPML